MPLSERFDAALAWASALHRTQERKGSGVPYVAHLLSVSALALEHGAGEDEAIAALLHDAVEDQGGLPVLDEIRLKFGANVADIVEGCTDAVTVPKPPWRARKERYVAHLAHASASIRLVSSCDKLHNARSILADYRRLGDAVWTRFAGGRDGTLWYYRALADEFLARGPGPVADELERTVSELHRLAGVARAG